MKLTKSNQFALEISLIIVIIGLTALMHQIIGFKMVVLNLFFLPVLLGAFFLGRYRAGVLALLSVVLVTVVSSQDLSQFASMRSPLASGLAITIWAGVLGLTTILAGTLSDERTTQMDELHEAYIGVIEVLSKYLHSVHPSVKDRPLRIADLSQRIGMQLRMSTRDLDDVRVASLLQEMDHIEITARVVRKAIGNLDSGSQKAAECTFNASDLVQSLGAVINGALPLLCRFDDTMNVAEPGQSPTGNAAPPLGAQIIRTARDFDRLVYGQNAAKVNDPAVVIKELQSGMHGTHSVEVLVALEQIVLRQKSSEGKTRSTANNGTKPSAAASTSATVS
jgi:hypothetical protein